MRLPCIKETRKREGKIFDISLFYLGLLIVILIFRSIAGEKFWISIILLYMPQVYFLYPAILITLIGCIWTVILKGKKSQENGDQKRKTIIQSIPASISRMSTSFVINLVSIFLVLFVFMQLKVNFSPENFPRDNGSKNIKVVTYNIRAGTFGAKKVAAQLKKFDADLVFLQEARQTTKGEKPDPVPVILDEFRDWNYIRGGSGNELMILSRFTFTGYGEKNLGRFRKCLIGKININGREVKVINVHFSTADTKLLS